MAGTPTILVVDDEPKVGLGIRLALERELPCRVLTATDGREALRLARAERPDAILLDVMMPGMAGGEVAEALRDDPTTAGIPVIFLTGLIGKAELAAKGGVVGGERYLAKPASAEELKAALAEVLRPGK